MSSTDTLILDLWQLYEHIKKALNAISEFMNMTVAEAITKRPFSGDLTQKIEQWLLEQTEFGQLTVMSLMLGSGIVIFLSITFIKWLWDLI